MSMGTRLGRRFNMNFTFGATNFRTVCSVFLDVQKAFDSVPHTILVNKLQSHGLNVYLLRWICDYLSGREQCGVTSRPQPVPSGVPQGSSVLLCTSTIWLICNCLRAPNWLHMQMIYYCTNQLIVMLTTTECRRI